MSFRPVDAEARARARADHATSLVLEAGAGTGKTTLLIDRIEALLRSGAAELDQIAAVTFTENAATTMKLRLRERLERARGEPGLAADERARVARALDGLERAQISTIHALCAALLQERPLDAGVAPGFRVADEAQSDLLFSEAWEEWLGERLVEGDAVLLEALEREIPLEGEGPWGERSSLRGLARTLLDQRDLAPLVAIEGPEPEAWRDELLAQAERVRGLLLGVQDGDTLAPRLQELLAFAEGARRVAAPALAAYLVKLPVIARNAGQKPRWPSAQALDEGRRVAEWTRQAQAAWAGRASAALHGRLVGALQGVVERYERQKRAEGLLDFLDLLLRARDALRDHESVRRYFRRRFRFLIIDEFQDTDPLQMQVAQLLAGGRPGGLVVVGDAKQSIYRFRRAEASLFRRIASAAGAGEGHAVLQLTQNFRSRPAILRFVNRVFAELITASDEAGQPAYEPIAPPPGLPEAPAVIALRFEAPYAEGDDLLRAEATALTALVAQAAGGRYEVRDPLTGASRASRAGDVMVLSRRLTQVRHLEEAFEAAGLRFAVEGGKSFFDRQEVHEALSVLRAIDDPSDAVSLTAALRSSFFGVSDRDIVAYVLSGGRLWVGQAPEELPGSASIGPALRLLGELQALRTRSSPAALLERLYDETRILAALAGSRRGEAQSANLEKVAALARQASELGVLTLRGFTRLLQDRIDTAREEPDLPSTRPGDPHTVRVLSIHKAKGLEAPIVALYDSADAQRVRPDLVPLWDEGRIAVGFRGGCQPPGWEALVQREEAKARAESRRLLYVACTRARDWLLIPQPPSDARAGSFWRELSGRLPAASDADVEVVDAATLPPPLREEPPADLRGLAGAEGGDAVAARWEAERRAVIEAGAERPFVPVSALSVAAREAPPAVLAPGSTGGRDFGSLVHKLLEWIPLDAGEAAAARLEAMASALAPVHGLDADAGRRAAEAARRALGLPLLERARRARRLWRELRLWLPQDGELIEGVVDLAFEEDGQLVVVDYKTDRITEDQAIDQAAHHAPQLRLYGRGLTLATGMPVRERLVLFTTIGRAVPV